MSHIIDTSNYCLIYGNDDKGSVAFNTPKYALENKLNGILFYG